MTKRALVITDEQIRALRTEAAAHGDHAQALICDLAIGDVVLDDDTTIESLRISAFLPLSDRRRIGALSVEECRDACVEVIELARIWRRAEVIS